MKTLETEISYQGRKLKQLKRVGMIAMYGVFGEGNALYGYEVIKIRIAPAKEMFGKLIPEHEVYPSSSKNSNDWGTSAWSYGTGQRNRALARFNGLLKSQTAHGPESNLDDLNAG
jgi:hypothetical protein